MISISTTSFFDRAWVWWLVAVAVTFIVLEAAAFIKNGPGYTLSEHLWKWLKIRDSGAKNNNLIVNPQPTTWIVRARRLGVIVLFLWLLAHIFTGGKI